MTKEKFEAIFNLAGIEILSHWELVNQYWANTVAMTPPTGSWWLAKTKYGLIRIGWRKRVIEIDWSDTKQHCPNITKDEVTKNGYCVHAWTELKAAEYLAELKRQLETPCKP